MVLGVPVALGVLVDHHILAPASQEGLVGLVGPQWSHLWGPGLRETDSCEVSER